MLREDGGFDYKKAIVESILILIREIPDAKESGLAHLCEFIEVRRRCSAPCRCVYSDTWACRDRPWQAEDSPVAQPSAQLRLSLSCTAVSVSPKATSRFVWAGASGRVGVRVRVACDGGVCS